MFRRLCENNYLVTVRDKYPQINVRFDWHTFLKKKCFRTDGQTDTQTNGQTNRRTVRLYYAPNFIWGHKKRNFPIDPIVKVAHFWQCHVNMTLPKVSDFYNWGLWRNSLSFVRSCRNFVPEYIKNIDANRASFSSKLQGIK